MIKIKISPKTENSVSQMVADEGWVVRLYWDQTPSCEFLTAERGPVRFMVRKRNNSDNGEIRKYVYGKLADTKTFSTDGCGICGTLYISDHAKEENVYAYFRNERLQNLADRYGIQQVVFSKTGGALCTKDMGEAPSGTIATDGWTERDGNQWRINDATYILHNGILTLPQMYNIGKLERSLTNADLSGVSRTGSAARMTN